MRLRREEWESWKDMIQTGEFLKILLEMRRNELESMLLTDDYPDLMVKKGGVMVLDVVMETIKNIDAQEE